MNKQNLPIIHNKRLNGSVFEMTLDCAFDFDPGQFVNVSVEGFYLRRPISVCGSDGKTLKLVYKVVGGGTEKMSEMEAGESVDVLFPLGNGFDFAASRKPLLIGGGIGCAPLYKLAKEFNEKGVKPNIVLGFKNSDEIFYKNEFAALGNLIIATDDGSAGVKGNAVSVLKEAGIAYDRYFACGPQVMLKFLKQYSVNGQLSLEARMGCGFGACMGCSVMTTEGAKRVCKEGPVFDADKVLFD